jgi:hypothetical protein
MVMLLLLLLMNWRAEKLCNQEEFIYKACF